MIQFELKEEHIKLLKHLRWSINKENIINGVANEGDEIAPPFGEHNIYEAFDIILNGKPSNFNPNEETEFPEYSDEQKEAWGELYNELTIALEIILFTQSFELGKYKARYNERIWKKIS